MTQRINLYNRSLLPRPDWLLLDYVLVYVAVAALIAIIIGAFASREARRAERALADSQQQLEQVQQQLEALSRAPRPRVDAMLQQQRQAALDEQQQLHQILNMGSRTSVQDHSRFSSTLAALARQVPRGVWLTAIELGRDGTTLDGYALNADLVPTLTQALSADPALGGRRFAGLEVKSQALLPHAVATSPEGSRAEGKAPALVGLTAQGGLAAEGVAGARASAPVGAPEPASLSVYRFRLGQSGAKP